MPKCVAKDKDGNVVEPGAEVIDFRGDPAFFRAATRPNGGGKDGKVRVKQPGLPESEYYASVYDLTVSEPESEVETARDWESVRLATNRAARFLPAESADPDTLPCVEVGGVQVYAYWHADGGLRVSVDLDTVEPQFTVGDSLVPMQVAVQGEIVFSDIPEGSHWQAAPE